VVTSIQRVTDIMGEISAASSEQAIGVAKVGDAVQQMDQGTQQNAALVEEMAAAASSLKTQATDLVHTVSVFKLNDHRGAFQAAPARSRAAVAPGVVQSAPLQRTAQPAAISNSSFVGIDLDSAIRAHAEWRSKLRAAATGRQTMDAEIIACDDCCELGKWLHGRGKSQYGTKASFTALLDNHRSFHTEAGKVARLINQAAYDEAERQLESGSAFSQASNRVGSAVVQLQRELQGGAAPASTAKKLPAPPKPAPTATKAGTDDEWETF
jgi:hypothetical protein